MKNAIILHGTSDKEEYYSDKYPSASNFHWLPWLQKQLLIKDIHAVTPEMPHGYAPDYDVWKKEFERYEITPETILVGHSCGGGFIVRYLSENKDMTVGNVILVAPWLDPDKVKQNDFFEFKIDKDLATRTKNITIFHSDNDMDSVQRSVQMIRHEIENIDYREFHNKGHFCLSDLRTDAFPELLNTVLE